METTGSTIRERLAQLAKPDDRLAELRQQLANNPDAVRKAIAAQMRRSGAFQSRRTRRPVDMGPSRSQREGTRHALSMHNAKSGSLLRERYSDAVQNALGHLCVLLAESKPQDTPGGLIGIAARRCLEPLGTPHTAEELPPADSGAAVIAAWKAAQNRQWDTIDYAAAREGLAVRFSTRIDRAKHSTVVLQFADFVETFLSELPALPTTDRPQRSIMRRRVPVWFYAADQRPNRPAKTTANTTDIAAIAEYHRTRRNPAKTTARTQPEIPQRFAWTLFMNNDACSLLNDFAYGFGI